ncbi:MAG: hypothetical protein AAF687_06905 [Pseudomonadota bacterium]
MNSLQINRATLLAAPALVLLLAACEDEADPDAAAAEQGGKAEGDVLGGTISDDMIPFEQLESQSPPAKRADGAGANGDEGGEADEDESD